MGHEPENLQISHWKSYFEQNDAHGVRTRLHLNRPDAGWDQVRNAPASRENFESSSFSKYKAAYTLLSEKLRPQIYDLGILKE